MHAALYDRFIKFLTRNQHGFVKKNRSVVTNMLSFLKEIYEAIDNNAENHVIAFILTSLRHSTKSRTTNYYRKRATLELEAVS